ncbi:MAG: U32 family peptidase [Candidatus Delongbacteria bacterium]|nr:U32 family peptidase [Candidatus Delongbacteria bacterium]MBN2836657.1 U32 family peptidase [Candidatus Delongbacteria bacterium]
MELLSPAGSFESFLKAVENGCNAVYLGLKFFNARKPASNFSIKEYLEAKKIAKDKNVKIYVTFNTDLKDNDLEKAVRMITLLDEIGVDGLIVKDFSIIFILKEYFPNIKFHLSTQFGVCNTDSAIFADSMGAERVILAREVSIDEMKDFAALEKPEIEIFAQGSMCFSFSGRCLLSSFVGGKSANRGVCQAPCRVSYNCGDKNDSLFSMKDLNLIKKLDELKKLNISCLKIEGRLKNPRWVGDVTNIYRKVLDDGFSGEFEDRLKMYSGRDYSEGFVYGLKNLTSNNNNEFGRFLGDILEINQGKMITNNFTIDCDSSIRITRNGKFCGIIYDPVIDEYGENSIIKTSNDYYEVGDKLFEIKVAKQNKDNEVPDRMFDLDFNFDNDSLNIIVKLPFGNFVKDIKVKKIVKEKRGADLELLIDKIRESGMVNQRLRNSYFNENISLAKSQINNIIKDLTSLISLELKRNRETLPDLTNQKLINLISGIENKIGHLQIGLANINTLRITGKQFEVMKDFLFDYSIVEQFEDHIEKIKNYNGKSKIIISLYPILFNEDYTEIKQIVLSLKEKIHGIEINDIGQIEFCRQNGFKVFGGPGISVYNHVTVKFLQKLGIHSIHPAYELDKKAIENLIQKSELPVSMTVYTHIPLFFSRAEDERFNIGNEFSDKLGTELITTKYRSITNFYSKKPFIISDISFDNKVDYVIADLSYERDPIATIKQIKNQKFNDYSTFNLMRNLE